MYESYWQLHQRPFENCLDPRFYYAGPSHQAALLKLRYAIENRRGGALLGGASGTGKTLLVKMLETALGKDLKPLVHLLFPQMPADQLLAYLAAELLGSPHGPDSPSLHQSVRQIEHFLAENTRKQRHAVVVVDEAHLLEDRRTLEAIRLLSNFEWDGRLGLTLLLVGQPGLLPTLERMPQLEERLGVKCLLRPFTEQETADYVAHRLKVAGAGRTVFEPEALQTLHELTRGVARRINRLCDLALLIGYAEGQQTVTAAQLESVCQELVAVVPE